MFWGVDIMVTLENNGSLMAIKHVLSILLPLYDLVPHATNREIDEINRVPFKSTVTRACRHLMFLCLTFSS